MAYGAVVWLSVALGFMAQSPPSTPATVTARPNPAGGWAIKRTKSDFDDSRTIALSLSASNTITGWPRKTTRPTLIVRCKEGDLSAYVATGLTANPEMGETDVASFRVRWDAQPASSETFDEASSSDAYFFRQPAEAIASMLFSRKLTLGFTPFNSDPVVIAFNLPGLTRWKRDLLSGCPSDVVEAAPSNSAEGRAARAKEEKERKEVSALVFTLAGIASSDGSRPGAPARLEACDRLVAMGTAASAYSGNIGLAAKDDSDPDVRACAAKLLIEIQK